MHGRALAALVMASLLMLTGCSFDGGVSPTAADGRGTATAMETGTHSGQAPVYPSGFDENGVVNASAVEASHRSALLATSGFSVTYHATVATPNATTRVRYDQQTEVDSGELLRRTNVTSGDLTGEVVRYYANDTVYVKTREPGATEPGYDTRNKSYALGAATGLEFIRPALADVEYGASERTARDGVEVVVYDDATLGAADGLFGPNVSADDVSAFSARLVVGTDGVVRAITYEATVRRGGRARTVSVAIRVDTVGETTVDRPAWVDRA